MKEHNIRTEHKTTELGGVCGSFRNRQDGDSLLIFFQMVPLFSSQVEVVQPLSLDIRPLPAEQLLALSEDGFGWTGMGVPEPTKILPLLLLKPSVLSFSICSVLQTE